MAKRTDKSTKITALTLLARGDTIREVSEELGLSVPTVQSIKNKNSEIIQTIHRRMLDRKIQNANKILDKSNKMISKKLDKAELDETKKNELLEQYRNGEIDYKEFQQQTMGLAEVTIDQLTRVSREMSDQLKKNEIENPNPNSPQDNAEQLKQLMDAIQNGDEVTMQRITFGGQAE